MPEGFKQLSDVITQRELEEVAARYKVIAGFDRDSLNRTERSTPPGVGGARNGGGFGAPHVVDDS